MVLHDDRDLSTAEHDTSPVMEASHGSRLAQAIVNRETFSCVLSTLAFPWALMSSQHDSDLIWV